MQPCTPVESCPGDDARRSQRVSRIASSPLGGPSRRRRVPNLRGCAGSLCLVAGLVWFGGASANAQAVDPEPAVAKPDDRIVGPIHRLTRSAQTVQDYSTIIERCATTIDQSDLANADRDYLKKLASWAYNRRCESRLEAAEYYQNAGLEAQAATTADEALSDAIQALEFDPSRWRAWVNRGVLLAQAGMLAEALADFEKVTELEPASAVGWYNAGEAHAALQRYDAAIACYDRAVQIDPGDLQSLTGRGLARLQVGKSDEALADFELVLKWMPQNAAALLNRGDAHLALRNWRQAYHDYASAAKIAESAATCQRAAWLLATCPEPEYYRPSTAKELATRAVDLAGPSLAALEALAAAHAALGEFEQAIDKQRQALELADDPMRAPCRERLARYEQHQPLQR